MTAPPQTRGRSTIDHRVVEKIASQAASEISTVGGQRRRRLGLGTRDDMSARPKVAVNLAGDAATITAQIGMPFPVPIRTTAINARARIADRVTALTGIPVRRVDVAVTWLATDQEQDRGLA